MRPRERPEFPQAGSIVGDWRLDGRLGVGGMGVVFRAYHRETGAPGALKLIRGVDGTTTEQLLRCRREVLVLARMNAPGIVRILDHDLDRDLPFFVMELLTGGSLLLAIEANQLDPERIRKLAVDLAAAVEALHAEQILHRDIKPANVLFDDRWNARLADFGIAKPLDRTALTLQDHVLGTLPYVAPEVLRGGASHAGSDLYQVGVTLFQSVTHRIPFTGADLMAVMAGQALPIPRFGPGTDARLFWLEPVVLDLLASDPARRIGSAGELRKRLEERSSASDTTVLRSRPPRLSAPGPAQPTQPYRPRVVGGLAIAGTLLIVVSLWWPLTPRESAGRSDARPSRPTPAAAHFLPASTIETDRRSFQELHAGALALNSQARGLAERFGQSQGKSGIRETSRTFVELWTRQAARTEELLVRAVFPHGRGPGSADRAGLALLDLFDGWQRFRAQVTAELAIRQPKDDALIGPLLVDAARSQVERATDAAVAVWAKRFRSRLPPSLRASTGALWRSGLLAMLACTFSDASGSQRPALRSEIARLADQALPLLAARAGAVHQDVAPVVVPLVLRAIYSVGDFDSYHRLLKEARRRLEGAAGPLEPAALLMLLTLLQQETKAGPNAAWAAMRMAEAEALLIRKSAALRNRLLVEWPYDPRRPAPAGFDGILAHHAVGLLQDLRASIEHLVRISGLPNPAEPALR